MDVEQKLQETYAGRLGAVETSRGDVDAARRTGARMRSVVGSPSAPPRWP